MKRNSKFHIKSMRKQIMKRAVAAAVACSVIFSTGIVAFAQYSQSAGYAGSTSVTAEVGFNGGNAYAKVRASDYVDARMDGIAYYTDSEGSLWDADLIGGFDQRTGGEVSVSCNGDFYLVTCDFNVYGSDGNWGWMSYTQ